MTTTPETLSLPPSYRSARNTPKSLNRLALCLALATGTPHAAADELTELSLEQLLEMTIVGASKYEQRQEQVAAAASVITREEIRIYGWRTLAEALASLPGVHTTYDRQYSYLGARGFGLPGDFNTRILITINGNRTNDVVFDGSLVGRDLPLDLDLIERIEYIPGPGGAIYGQNAMFAVVNVITRSGANIDGTELSVGVQDPQALRQGRVTWGRLLDNGVDVVLSVSGMRARGENHFLDFPGGGPDGEDISGIARRMDGERDRDLFARVSRGPWAFDFVYGDRRKDDPTASYLAEPLVPGQFVRDRNLHVQASYQESFADGTLHASGRAFLGRQRFTGDYIYANDEGLPIPLVGTGSSDWQGIELRLLSTAWHGHTLLVGLEAEDISRAEQTLRDPEAPEDDVSVEAAGYRYGLYVQDEWQITERFILTLGLRADHNKWTGTQWSPRTGLIWQPAPDTTLKALYGRAYRAPNSFERDYEDGAPQIANSSLDGESIDTLELVADHRPSRELTLRGSVYRWTIRDIITLGTVVQGNDDEAQTFTQYQSGGKVEATGVELSAARAWDWGGRARGSLAWQDVTSADGGRLVNSPRLLGKLNFASPLPGTQLRLGYELRYEGKRQTLDGTDVKGYWISNMNLTASRWVRGLDVSLGVYNLFDRRYAHPGSDNNWQNTLAQDGRSARLKVDYRF